MAEVRWSEQLFAMWQQDDIAGQIDELQRVYKKWIPRCAILTACGGGLMCATSYPTAIALGLLVAISGVLTIALMKTWAHIKLSMFRVIWELRQGEADSSINQKGTRTSESR